jgi:hypothetical protein
MSAMKDRVDLSDADFLRALAHQLEVHRRCSPFPLWTSDTERLERIAEAINAKEVT